MRASPVIDDYSDILEPQDHPAATRIITDLVALYGVPGVPEGLRRSLAVGLKERTEPSIRVASQVKRRSRLEVRATALLVAAATALVIVVAGYAVAPVIDQLLATERGVSTLPMQDIGQSQNANGITVRLDRAYADVNRVIVAYTIQVPAGFNNSTSGIDGKIALADSQVGSLPMIEGQGLAGGSPHASAGLVTFDAESLALGTARVDLRLTFPDVRAKAQQQGASDLSGGAFAFNFTLPVEPGRAIGVNKTVIANGVPVTLDRVVVSPSETRVYIRFPASGGITAKDWYADVHIAGNGWDTNQLQSGFSGEMTLGSMFTNTSGEHIATFSGDLRSRHGRWTVIVDALGAVDTQAAATDSGLPKQTRVAGPWTFRISVP